MPRKGQKQSEEAKRKISLANKGQKRPSMLGNTNGFKKGQPSFRLGKKHTEETRKKISQAKMGYPSPMKGKKLGFIPKCAFKKGHITWNKGKPYYAIRGEKNHFWTGGEKYERRNHEWKLIRKQVLIQYDFKCVHCGKEENIHIHHKIPFKKVKEHKIENLIPLCTSCHMKEEWKSRRGG